MNQITTETFHGFAFPVVRVRYAGPTNTQGSRWIASLRRDNERTFRVQEPYRDELGSGGVNALPAALRCLDKALKAMNSEVTSADYVAIPGDLSADTYAFTFVPQHFFEKATR